MTKPMTVWCVVMPDGEPMLWTLSESRPLTVRKATGLNSLEASRYSWKTEYKPRGYRCRKFRLEPINDN